MPGQRAFKWEGNDIKVSVDTQGLRNRSSLELIFV